MGLKLEDINLSHIYEYLQSGTSEKADPEVIRYLELLDKVRAMYNRIDEFGHKDLIVSHLIKVEGLSRYLANNIYNDAMEYFYCDKQISNEAWSNMLAEASRKDYIFAIQLAKTTADVVNASKIHLQIYKLKGLDKPEPPKIPDGAFQQPFKMYSIDTEFLGLPKKNKKEIKEMLEKFPEISEKVRMRLEEETGSLPTVRLFLNEHENPRKS
ncbi:hypothetical protein CJ739_79 [Mariniflexile rhizosphaerae]|uniref:hypothetical protein n=1 Tax=unclassified Mariniflexile TaxID=2643887 RepID=UPI000E332197|nr:hypothetical protein [Mariniflexile sp. TRM1-10]AXP79179.1 hypothetical protein CJ739_79 [Mariniflexile sp. TRM1-10]